MVQGISFRADGFYTQRRSWRLSFNDMVVNFVNLHAGVPEAQTGSAGPFSPTCSMPSPTVATPERYGFQTRPATGGQPTGEYSGALEQASRTSAVEEFTGLSLNVITDFQNSAAGLLEGAELGVDGFSTDAASPETLFSRLQQNLSGVNKLGLLQSGDPVATSLNQTFSNSDRNTLRDAFGSLLNQFVVPATEQKIALSVENPSVVDFGALGDSLRTIAESVSQSISDDALDRVLGALQLQQTLDPNSLATQTLPTLSFLTLTKQSDEQEIGIILQNLSQNPDQELNSDQVSSIVNQVRFLATNNVSSVDFPSVSTDAVTAGELAQNLQLNLAVFVSELSVPQINQEEGQTVPATESVDLNLQTNQQSQGSVLQGVDPQDLSALDAAKNTLGATSTAYTTLENVLRPYLDSYLTMETGEVAPGLSDQEREANVSRTVGPITTPTINVGLTDAFLISLFADAYNDSLVTQTAEMNQSVPGYGDRYDREGSSTEHSDTNIAFATNSGGTQVSQENLELPPVYERDSQKLEERFRDDSSDSDTKRTPSQRTDLSDGESNMNFWP